MNHKFDDDDRLRKFFFFYNGIHSFSFIQLCQNQDNYLQLHKIEVNTANSTSTKIIHYLLKFRDLHSLGQFSTLSSQQLGST